MLKVLVLGAGMAVLVACGGGGGGGGDSGGGTPPPVPAVSGKLSALAGDGRIVDAGGDQAVALVAIDSQGQMGAEVASTRTAADGSFRIELPAGQSFGAGLALVAADGAGGRWRALALSAAVDLGPASEACTQEFIAARTARGSAFAEPIERLARLQRNATLVMRLTDARSAEPQSAVTRLRARLRLDPAASAAFGLLGSSGLLPQTLGDIGGLFGAARGAWDVVDSSDGRHTLSAVPVAGSATDWNVADTPAGQTPLLYPARIRIASDGITSVYQPIDDPVIFVLMGLVGEHQVAAFSFEPGTSLRLTSIDRRTTGYDFDGDRVEDRLLYRIDQTTRGIENISAFGTTRAALRVDFRTELTLVYSASGRSVSVLENRSQWSIPFAGPVRVDSTVVGTDANGATTTFSAQRITERAVVNALSWPGEVHASAVPVNLPANYQFTTSLGVTEDLRYSFGGFLPGPCCLAGNGLSTRDLTGATAGVDISVQDANALTTGRYPSQDGSRVYMVISKSLPPEFGIRRYSMDPAQAAAYGAVIVRYDARTMQEEARIVLPPRMSVAAPGQAFARNIVFRLIVSPVDPTEFVVVGVDALLVRGTTVAPGFIGLDSEERVELDGRVHMLDGQVELRGWDGARNEVWLEINGGGPLGQIAPLAANGFDRTALRSGLPYMYTLLGGLDTVYDHIGADRAYVQGHRTVVDKGNGTVIRRLSESSEFGLQAARCTRRGEQILCSNGDTIYWLDKDLVETSRLRLHNDLRTLARGFLPSGPVDGVFAPRDGMLVYLGYDLSSTAFPNPPVALQLTF